MTQILATRMNGHIIHMVPTHYGYSLMIDENEYGFYASIKACLKAADHYISIGL